MTLTDIGIFGELHQLVQDDELRDLVDRCTTASQRAGQAMRASFETNEDAKYAVSEKALALGRNWPNRLGSRQKSQTVDEVRVSKRSRRKCILTAFKP